MSNNLSLSPRKEENREQKKAETPIRFSPSEIYAHFQSSIKSVKEMYDSVSETVTDSVKSDILRSQIVFSEAAMDFYIHEISKYCLFSMYIGNFNKSQKYYNLQLKMSDVEKAVNSSDDDWFFSYLNELLGKDVYLAGETVKDQLNLIGVGFDKAMQEAFPMPESKNPQQASCEFGKQKIADLFKRRNQIAHQSDRSHYSAELSPISKSEVDECIETIEKIVLAIHNIVSGKDS